MLAVLQEHHAAVLSELDASGAPPLASALMRGHLEAAALCPAKAPRKAETVVKRVKKEVPPEVADAFRPPRGIPVEDFRRLAVAAAAARGERPVVPEMKRWNRLPQGRGTTRRRGSPLVQKLRAAVYGVMAAHEMQDDAAEHVAGPVLDAYAAQEATQGHWRPGWRTVVAHAAASLGSVDVLQALPPEALVSPDAAGWLPAHSACQAGATDAVRFLKSVGATGRDAHGLSPRFRPEKVSVRAVVAAQDVAWLRLLARFGELAPDSDGRTAGHWAAYYGSRPIVMELMLCAPDLLTAPDRNGVMPWDIADERMRLLLEKNLESKAVLAHLRDAWKAASSKTAPHVYHAGERVSIVKEGRHEGQVAVVVDSREEGRDFCLGQDSYKVKMLTGSHKGQFKEYVDFELSPAASDTDEVASEHWHRRFAVRPVEPERQPP